jgi:hypothetical protein
MTKPIVTTNIQNPIPSEPAIQFEFGTFEGFNFRRQSAIERSLSALDVILWDHDQNGEAEFWPAGDHEGVALVFRGQSSVTCSEILALDRLLEALGGDSLANCIRIYHAVEVRGMNLSTLTVEEVEDVALNIFLGTCFYDLRKEAAYELFESYWPELYKAWESCPLDGLQFDTDMFLDSPQFFTEEIELGATKCLLVANQ